VARGAAAATDLLCLDELHVTDVADAMLLSRLFGELLARGCSVVITSNRPARDLYKGGLSRRYFEPFIHLVDDR
jgi:predicted ATPase